MIAVNVYMKITTSLVLQSAPAGLYRGTWKVFHETSSKVFAALKNQVNLPPWIHVQLAFFFFNIRFYF